MGFRSVVKKVIPRGAFHRIEPFGHLLEAVLVQTRAGFPAKDLKVIGVTGTDGKTSTCMLIAQMLRDSGLKVGMITTVSVDYADDKGEQPSPTHMTTASVSMLARMLGKIKANNPDWVVIETSSHALAQHRVWGIPYSIGVFTNLSHEHLDYHRTFAAYRSAKTKLFKLVSKNKKGLQTGVINADDKNARYFEKATKKPVLYGVEKGDLQAENIVVTPNGSTYTVSLDDQTYDIVCNIPGRFNVYNSLAAVGVGRAVGLSEKQIEKGIASLKTVPGRMFRVEAGQSFDVIVDYAVTPAALENVLKATRETTKGTLRIVFGATGDRDKTKRPVMGEVVAKLADKIYLTDDETYTEDPAAIRRAVLRGIETADAAMNTQEFDDRGDAIKAALRDSKKGDTVLITGLGHQTTRNMGGRDEPWSDTEFVTTALTS